MTDNFLNLLDSETNIVALEAGQELFKKGDAGHQMFVVKSGEVQIFEGNHIFATVGVGGIVGEMAIIEDGIRSATVRALGAAVVIPVDVKQFQFLVQQAPFFAIRVMRVMSDRLKAMNSLVTSTAD